MRSTLLTLLLIGVVPAGCQAGSASRGQASPGEVAPPMALDESVDSTWMYLRLKYDSDSDGRVTPAEYVREGGDFDRLDRDDDGLLTAADFEPDPDRRRNMMRGMQAQRVVAVYFQVDEPGALGLDELRQAVAAYDADGDDAVDEAEFAAMAAARKVKVPGGDSPMVRRTMRDLDPWAVLIATVDADEDGVITSAEFVAFFKSRDDGDLVWSLDRSRDRGGRGAMSGVPEGEIAPDFALQPPDGGETVTLASFRRNLPVALIFGSYT